MAGRAGSPSGDGDAGSHAVTPETNRQRWSLRRYLFTPMVTGSVFYPELQRQLFAAEGTRLPTENRTYVVGCGICLLFVPAWLIWAIIVFNGTDPGQAFTPAVQMRAWGWPAAALAALLLAGSLLRPWLSAPERLMRQLLRGQVLALRETDAVRRLAEVAVDGRPGYFERARDLLAAEQWRHQSANLLRLADWTADVDDMDTAPEQLRVLARRLRTAARDRAALVARWCDDVTGEGSR